MYLDLLARCLTGMIYEDPPIDPWRGVLRNERGEIVLPETAGQGQYTLSPGRYDPAAREAGRDWPQRAETMIGLRRLLNLQTLIEQAVSLKIPGDVAECGVWRGGACIFMRAVLKAFDISDRRVYVADSFCGLPPPSHEADARDLHAGFGPLAVSLEDVKRNFERYGLLDDQVCFLPGFFEKSLPGPIERLALLRIDADMYGSTTEVLTALYDKLSPGGFCVIDDFNLPAVRQAISDFLKARNETPTPHVIDQAGVYWTKGT